MGCGGGQRWGLHRYKICAPRHEREPAAPDGHRSAVAAGQDRGGHLAGPQQSRWRREWHPTRDETPPHSPLRRACLTPRGAWQYSYRICPSTQKLTEACFQAHPLSFVREEHSLVDRNSKVYPVNGTFVTEGTFPHGSEWARIPIPSVALGVCCIAGPNDTATTPNRCLPGEGMYCKPGAPTPSTCPTRTSYARTPRPPACSSSQRSSLGGGGARRRPS